MKSQLIISLCFISIGAFAQAELNKKLQLTGSGPDAKIEGIQEVSGAQDAVSAEVHQKGGLIYAADGGAADAYAVTLAPAVTAYTTGMIVNFKAANSNTGASTLNVNGLGAVSIKKGVTEDLAADDIKAGQMVSVIYDGTSFQMLSMSGNGSGGGGGGVTTAVFTSETACISDAAPDDDLITWGEIFPAAQAGGYLLKDCWPRRVCGSSGTDGHWIWIRSQTDGGCGASSAQGHYISPAPSDTWASTAVSRAGAGSWGGGATCNGGSGMEIVCVKSAAGGGGGTGETRRIFVTSTTGNGDFSTWAGSGGANGLTGADNICNARAAAASLGGTWVAFLSTSTVDAKDRVSSITHHIVNMKGHLFLYNGDNTYCRHDCSGGTQMFGAVNPITFDEFGNEIPGGGNDFVWTGSDYSGLKITGPEQHSNNWTDGTAGSRGQMGCGKNVDNFWKNCADNTCDQTKRLYCVEQ